MGDRYRIELVRIGDEKDDVVFALEGAAELVAGTGAALVSDAVRGDAADRDGDDSTYVTSRAEQNDADAEGQSRPKRRRRTKAEIAADELAAQQQNEPEPVATQAAPPAESAPAAVGPVTAAVVPGTDGGAPYDPFAAK